MRWLPRRSRPYVTAAAMIGVKSGDRLLVLGEGAERLAAELALVTGLNGRTLLLSDSPGAAARVEAAAAAAGALVEFDVARPVALPGEPEAFDVIVLHQMLPGMLRAGSPNDEVAREARRLLRPGGRLVALEGGGRRGLTRVLPAPASIEPTRALEFLGHAGFRAVRVLATAEGITYIEAIRGSDPFSTDSGQKVPEVGA